MRGSGRLGIRLRRAGWAGLTGATLVLASMTPAAADDADVLIEPVGPAAAPAETASPPAATASVGIDRASRASVRAAYDNVYAPLRNALAAAEGHWSGSLASCSAGTTNEGVKDDMLDVVNFYRALAGLAPVTRSATLDETAQAAALIMDANGALSHAPSSSWQCWTQPGSTGAANSNLYLAGSPSPVLIDSLRAFMDDHGPANSPAGHRRWVLWPPARPIGIGATDNAVAMWVTGMPGATNTSPSGVPEYIAWPGDGYWPVELATDRWSLSHSDPGADLSNAAVVMTHDGQPVGISVHHGDVDYGYLPSVTWDVTDPSYGTLLDSGADVTFEVTVSGIETGGKATNHSYTVTFATDGPLASNGVFVDDDLSPFEADIQSLATAGITLGCNPPANTHFCPDSPVTRGQMAAFLVRALDLGGGGDVDFTDDDDSPYENDIAKLATAGITLGCNPPADTHFCPDSPVTRGQMAAFLVRAGLTD